MSRPTKPFISIIVPVYNEQASITAFINKITPLLAPYRYELLFINDGSTDNTEQLICAEQEKSSFITLINFSRNFGKEAALTAGFDHICGDIGISMDGDLQHPPELIPVLIEKWREGYDVVYTVREKRDDESWIKRFATRIFYLVFNKLSQLSLPEDASDFRLLDKKAVVALNKLRERSRFMKGLFSWVGYKSIGVTYMPDERHGGASNWGFTRLFNFALDGITAFSSLPLRIWSYVGIIFALGAFIYGGILIAQTIIFGKDLPGYASLMVAIFFFGGIQLFSLGVIGEYVGRIFNESKNRPLYLVDTITTSEIIDTND
ncbi:MAG: glycosyltransferase family 2 protein [Porticoccaceae bacterium]